MFHRCGVAKGAFRAEKRNHQRLLQCHAIADHLAKNSRDGFIRQRACVRGLHAAQNVRLALGAV